MVLTGVSQVGRELFKFFDMGSTRDRLGPANERRTIAPH